MKEAAGEANMTVITIVLIAIVLGVGAVIINNMMETARKRSCCMSMGGIWKTNYGRKPRCYAWCGWGDSGVYYCAPEIQTNCK